MVAERPLRKNPDIFAGIAVDLMMLETMRPPMVFASLAILLACGIVTELLGFIRIKSEFHSALSPLGLMWRKREVPLSVG
jgi:hypothetical protein